METAIRWSPSSTTAEQRFLSVDVVGKAFRLCKVTSFDGQNLEHEVLAAHTKVPAFRAFDWSPADESLVAVGQSSGDATILRLNSESQESFSFPIRHQRYCNAVAFSTHGLLAAGLDRVRNDFCLNVWDVNQRLAMRGGKGVVEPLRKLASSEPITSVKFFRDQPDTLVAGFPTRCVHGLAIDWLDENYIASCLTSNDPTICIWDRRVGSRYTTPGVGPANTLETGQPGPALEFKNVIAPKSTIWSLRFSRTKRGCLGVLANTGHFKTYDVAKEYLSEEYRSSMDETLGQESSKNYPEQIYTKYVRDVSSPFNHPTRGYPESERIVSFDFLNMSPSNEPTALTLSGNGQVNIITTKPPSPPVRLSSQGLLIRGTSGDDADFRTISPLPSQGLRVSEVIEDLRERILPSHDIQEVSRENHHTKPLSSREARERALSLGASGNLITAEEALTLLTINRLRCDTLDTRHLEPDARLDISKVIVNLVREQLNLPETRGCETDYPEHRRLCLRLCGAAQTHRELEELVRTLSADSQHTKAAALAVFQDEAKLAYLALRSHHPTQAHKLLAMAIAGAAKGDTDPDWEDTCAEIAKELTDPYARAILALVSKGDWNSVIQETTLPLKYRIEVAVRWLPDDELTEYINEMTAEAILQGDIEGIVLTGLGPSAMDLFQSYIRKFNDVQTPVLAMSHSVPRFINNNPNRARFEAWRETYRWQINSWKLQLERARFDVGSRKFAVTWDGRKLIEPPRQQVSLTCNYCTRPLTQHDASSQLSPSTTGEVVHPTPGNPLGTSAMSGMVCPRCGRHMPRCGVCTFWLGSPDPMSKACLAADAGQQAGKPTQAEMMRRFIVFCMNCNHGFHAHHAQEWFMKHRLAWRKLKSLKVTFPEIVAAVATSDKKRFALLHIPSTEAQAQQSTSAEASTEHGIPTTSAGQDSATETALAVSESDLDPAHFLIRATQGHSIKSVDAASLMEKLSLDEEAKLPDTVVHGTFHAAWPAILASGGLKSMGRNQVHFATGPSVESVLAQGAQGSKEVTGDHGEKVISGMRRDAQVLIYIDLKKALAAGCPFWRSENGVILSEGMVVEGSSGIVPVEFFDVVVERKHGLGKIWEGGKEVQALPEELVKQGNPKGRRNANKKKEDTTQP
ncbi:unnamed protein product [Aspergillus oryzae var. brunneus]|uniref:Unnamed protein product n=2 Tax=Aspergillus oryzae TaxID=5062 RepID=A0AAN4YW37_ASPOZ|nr:unnamed protein product [Aspergillus oryzae]GMG45081.1 unnamed protein product [Aspergillus oryzae var. brunneus]